MKINSFIPVFLCLIISFISTKAISTELNSTSQKLDQLSKHSQWHDLLHYHKIGLFASYESQADDPKFFLSEEGKSDPYAELQATISAFLQEPNKEADSIQCEFPARLNWLKSKLGNDFFPKHECKEFDDWFNKIDAKALTLIFPAAYLNSPSSMFGHTLIRIDRASGKNPLLDYSVNYAANADPDDNELVFSYKGLSGGYPGVFTILPYYQKVKEYSFLESRDVWEYELKLNKEEVDQFIRHTWEIRNTYFDYYFFDENCSYHLLTILDAASPRLNFSDQFKLTAIPADTVRAISEADLIGTANFRPSTLSLMKEMLNQANQEIRETAKSLVETSNDINERTEKLSDIEKAQALELAYQYSRYLSVRKKNQTKALSQRSVQLLSARSKISDKNAYKPFPEPVFRDDQGHFSKRLETRFGLNDSNLGNNKYTQIGLRMSYHDLLDPIPGYIKGAKLEMFNLQIRHHVETDQTRIQSVHLIDIASFSPRNNFVTPTSWHVATGLKRPNSAPQELSPFLTGGAGYSYQWKQQLFYSLFSSELNVDSDINKGFRLASGPRIGWLTQHHNWSAGIEINYMHDIYGSEFKEHNINFGLSYNLSKNWQLRLESEYQQYFTQENNSKHYDRLNSISFMHYF